LSHVLPHIDITIICQFLFKVFITYKSMSLYSAVHALGSRETKLRTVIPPHLASHMPASTSDTQISGQREGDEGSLDVNLLKELDKKALIDALNSVREYSRVTVQPALTYLFTGEWREDSRARLFVSRTTRLSDRSRTSEGKARLWNELTLKKPAASRSG
jgi:hypothetical protein